MARSVGIRELKDHLSEILRAVKDGESVQITDRNEPIASIVPFRAAEPEHTLRELSRLGIVTWGGGRPCGADEPPDTREHPVSEAVIEDRR